MQESNILRNDIIRLIELKTESKNHDFKLTCNWNSKEKDAKLNIVKDILAMANTQDGGKIIFGVENSSYTLVGISPEEFGSFDQTDVNQFLEKYADPKFAVQVSKFSEIDNKSIVVIYVPEYKEIPIICAKNAGSSKNSNDLLLREGANYIGTEKATTEEIHTSEVMRDFISRAVMKTINLKYPDESSAEKYKKDIESSEKFINEKIGDELNKYGAWEVIAYPSEYKPVRVEDFSEIEDLVKKSQVLKRGWPFPTFENDQCEYSNFNNGIQNHIKNNRRSEAFRLYQSGLFSWKGSIIQGVDGITKESEKSLYHISAIYKITEFIIFLKSIYEGLLSTGKIYIKIQMTNCNNRKLISSDPGFYIAEYCISKQDVILIFENEVDLFDLTINHKKLVCKSIKRLFELFNWNNFPEPIINEWQEKLINRQFLINK